MLATHCMQASAQPLAAALRQWWALPDQVAAARLEAAHAAAARSCAHLRCPSLGLEGGAAAGQGVGCKRCSGCRVAYYCSEGGREGEGLERSWLVGAPCSNQLKVSKLKVCPLGSSCLKVCPLHSACAAVFWSACVLSCRWMDCFP